MFAYTRWALIALCLLSCSACDLSKSARPTNAPTDLPAETVVNCPPEYMIPAPLIDDSPVLDCDAVVLERDKLIVDYGTMAKRMDSLIACINAWALKTRPKP